MLNIFSRTYFATGQEQFKKALKEEDLEEAERVLEKMPAAHNHEEALNRATILVEGYRAITEVYKNIVERQGQDEDNSLEIPHSISTPLHIPKR